MQNQKRIYNESEREKMYYFIRKIIEEDYEKIFSYCLRFLNSLKYKSIDIEPDDIIFSLIKKIYEGKRKVYLDDYEKFKGSFNYHLKKSLLDFRKSSVNDYNKFKDSFRSEEDEDYEYMGEFSGDINISDDYERKEIIEKIREILKPYKEEFEVFELMSKGYERDEIAKKLNVSSSDVTNIRKRIVRKLKSIPKSMVS